ncbi:MAG: VOC family protein [Chlorobi bacterium]|nr:VOC family protein [Chlorobiota bacterium]
MMKSLVTTTTIANYRRTIMETVETEVNVKELGEARLEVARQAKTREDWDRMWKESPEFLFSFGTCWRQCIEYKVDDFASEVGFFIDVLGFVPNAFDQDYAMFTGPDRNFFFSLVPTDGGESPTPPDAIKLEFMISDLEETMRKIEKRGVDIEEQPGPVHGNDMLIRGGFRTPNGIAVKLWEFKKGD